MYGKYKVMAKFLPFRFPIPYLRTGNIGDKYPWWKRTLREEILVVELSDMELRTGFNTSDVSHSFELLARDLHGLFQEHPNEPPILFIRTQSGRR